MRLRGRLQRVDGSGKDVGRGALEVVLVDDRLAIRADRGVGAVLHEALPVAGAQIDALEKALDQYRLDTGRYPNAELGLKALAIYRDGSKTAQALRTDAQEVKEVKAKAEAAISAGEEVFTGAEVEAQIEEAVAALDQALRPTWLFAETVHEGCDRGSYYEEGEFANEYGSPKCLVKLGCWGPVVNCNVPKRGWMAGIGGCPNVGGICIGCTMPGFPDKFMPFMDEPPGGTLSSSMTKVYGAMIRKLRSITNTTVNKEPKWRHNREELTTGYEPRWGN